MKNPRQCLTIETLEGCRFKPRKNGRMELVIDAGGENEETIRVTPF